MIAACGMNCGICSAYLRDKNKCTGCRSKENILSYCLSCKIRNCDKKKNFCFECDEFPCQKLKHLDKRYRTKYAMSMIENLENIKKLGVKKFEEVELERWKCKSCGGTINVHKGKCQMCGTIKKI